MTHHDCHAHSRNHIHGPDCGHELVRHGDHDDYLVGDHLHHVTRDGCVDHGAPPARANEDPETA